MPPGQPKSAPRGTKSAPRALQEYPRAPQDHQNDSLGAFPASHKTPKTTQETPKSSQEAPKRLSRRSQETPKRTKIRKNNLNNHTLFIIGFDLAKSRNQRLDCQRHYFALKILAITIKCQNPLKRNARGLPALKNTF